MRAVLLAKVVSLIGKAVNWVTVFSLSKTACLAFPLRPEGMDMTMVLHTPKSRLAMDTASRG